jgi:hypothetical protein
MTTSAETLRAREGRSTGLAAVTARGAPVRRARGGLSLVEVMVSLAILATFMIGFLMAFVQSRRLTETSIMHAAATTIVYGLIEQIKQLDYASSLPSQVADPGDPDTTTPPLMRVRLSQNTLKWLRVVHTAAPGTPAAPTLTPDPTASAASVAAIDNLLGDLPLSTLPGARSQSINLNLWIWVDELPDTTKDVSEVKKVTIVYTYSFQTGSNTRTVRNREVFLRTRYDQ